MLNLRQALIKCFDYVFVDESVRQATAFLDARLTVKMTRQHKPDHRHHDGETYILTFGKPNYAEREFIAKCKAAGESFPVRKIQLKYYPEKKRKKAA